MPKRKTEKAKVVTVASASKRAGRAAGKATVSSTDSGNGSAGAIRKRNVARILKAAEAVFSKDGFAGASTAEIARKAGVPKANLHYYFRTKQDLYSAVLVEIVESWLDALEEIESDSDPAAALAQYIAKKMEAAKNSAQPSRLWAIEIIGGGRHVQPFLKGRLRKLVEEKGAIVQKWIDQGKIEDIDPPHLFFMIWAMTQTYADFGAQMTAVLGRRTLDDAVFEDATQTATRLILRGLGLKSPL
ncbi:TetR/AcrR family transcriptional regulator [Parvibaculum sp.]|uniref:TetR/AcrR family transcriptional regulator n=1 Tax=Parvibaculum sp. TaxID=2024848 RepID=UPI003210E03D